MTGIEWTQETWNPIIGCSIVSSGCTNCYAMKMAVRLEAMGIEHYKGTTKQSKGGAVWTGKIALAPDHVLLKPLRWRNPKTIFVNSMGDLFHEDIPDEWIDKVFAVMALCPHHTFQILTKRSARMREYLDARLDAGEGHLWRWLTQCEINARLGFHTSIEHYAIYHTHAPVFPLRNVWLGVSCEDQKRADERIPDLLATPASVRFISAEPLLGEIRLHRLLHCRGCPGCYSLDCGNHGLHWVIVGGESGPSARPMHPDWARSLRDQCVAASVPFFFKQWGEWADADDYASEVQEHYDVQGLTSEKSIRVGKRKAGRILDGRKHDDMPQVHI